MINRFIFAIIVSYLIFSITIEAQYRVYLPIILKTHSVKKGLAASPFYPGCADAATVAADWYLNWTPTPGVGCDGADFVPMIWGAANFDATLVAAIINGQTSGWIIGFNEPDMTGQANIDPTTGAILWRLIEAEAGDLQLVSPSPSQHNPGWLGQMVSEYRRLYGNEPRFDAIGVHIYHYDPATMMTYITARHNEWPGLPVWITEFNGCLGENNPELMTEIVPWLEAQPWVLRYFWFVSRPDNNPDTISPCTLMTPAGELTPAGVMYAGQ